MDGIRGLPLLSGPPPHSEESEYCRKCNKEFNRIFNKAKRCNHCGYQYCGSCCNHSALMPRIGVYNGFDPADVCSYCIEVLKVTAMGRASLRAMPLAHLKAYLSAYGLSGPSHAVEKEDYVRAVLDARQSNGCLPKANEDYYRRHSIPRPTGERPKGFLARMAESFSDFVDSLPQPDSSSHAPPVPPRHTAPRPPPRTTANRPPPPPASPHPQTTPGPSNTRSAPQQAPPNPPRQSNPPPPPPTQRPTPQVPPMDELLAMKQEGISALSIGMLKAILQHHHVRIPQDALEKRDLVDRVVTLVESARVDKEREARARAAEEEAELEAQRRALEEIERKRKAAAQKDDAGSPEGQTSQEDAPAGIPKAAAPMAAKLERDGLCVICQDEDANIAIVDCGLPHRQPDISVGGMSNLVPYNQHEYRPLQVAPPMGSNNLMQPLVQQPTPIPQQQLQIQPGPTQPSPRPNEYGQNSAIPPFMGMPYPPHPAHSPFDWIVPTITSLLNAQHATVLAKLNEASERQISLAAKVDALQQRTDAVHQTMNNALEHVQQVSDKVARLGADMSSRDATLAERLNALDDAIEAWPIGVKLANGSTSGAPTVGELQTPPGSDEPSRTAQPGTQGTLQQDEQLQSLDKVLQGASSLEDDNATMQPELRENGSSLRSPASQNIPGPFSVQEGVSSSTPLTQEDIKPPRPPSKARKSAGTPQAVPPTPRRSSRQSKKRQRDDGTSDTLVAKKKAKTPRMSVGGKVPRKSLPSQFNWLNVPIQDEELEQLIYCDKCDQSYHWGCVNILPEDPVLHDDSSSWLCPPCAHEDQYGPIPGRTYDPNVGCRPDCAVQDRDWFAIDAIIGRFPHSADPSGVMMQYLVKWEGYGIERSTWTPENEIGQAVHALVKDFEKAALKENLDVSDKSQLILLQKARDAGWGYYTFPSTS